MKKVTAPRKVGRPPVGIFTGRSGSWAGDLSIVSDYSYGYRNREDITNTKPGVLVIGSQNVLTNVSDRIQVRKGYTMDGAKSDVAAPIASSFDWDMKNNSESHLRAGFLTTTNDGKLQYRYDNGTTVTWRDLKASLTNVEFNFATFYIPAEFLRVVLFCNGDGNIYEWNGAVTTIASVTTNTLTKSGTSSWKTAGIYDTANKKVIINGIEYTYTAGEGTTTLTGVTPDPTGTIAGDIVHQSVVSTAFSTFSATIDIKPNLIASLNSQVYYGSTEHQDIYISKNGNYKDVSFNANGRIPGDGATARLDANCVGFIVQEEDMYITAGKDEWYKTLFAKTSFYTSSLNYETTESFDLKRLKTNALQSAQSQAFMTKIKNDVVVLTNEPTIDTLGRIENILGTPQTNNISDSIKLDVDDYDFTDGSIFYYRYFIYMAVPKEGIIRVYNLIKQYWEAPLTIPVSRFAIINGELYGHSYLTSETYKLFDGYSDRSTSSSVSDGNPIDAIVSFAYQNYGTRTAKKRAEAIYIEGYIASNTEVDGQITFEMDGCSDYFPFSISGVDESVVCLGSTVQNSLGKYSLGKQGLGTSGSLNITGLPPKVRVIKTFTPRNFFECQVEFRIYGVDNRFELLAFGLNARTSEELNSEIEQ